MSSEQKFDAFVNDDKVLVFTATTYGDITGDTHQFKLVDGDGNLKLTKTTGSGITITVAGGVSTYAVIEVDISNGLEVAAANYEWQLRRTNAGREDTLAFGRLPLRPSFRDAT